MNRLLKNCSLLVVPMIVAACASMPGGPSVMALPGTGKSFNQFRADDDECRQYASMQIGEGSPNQASADSLARSAALGTAVGAVAGAAMGGRGGAGVGAGTGLAVGTMAGVGAGDSSAYGLQRRYDYAFLQCMYAKGHKVPVSGHFESSSGQQAQGSYPPPPPPPPPPKH